MDSFDEDFKRVRYGLFGRPASRSLKWPEIWASSLGREVIFGVEDTGSYGAGLASAIRRHHIGVLEVLRTDRRDRRLRGKSDTIDAENAARAVLNGQASAVPKSADGAVEMIRPVKVAKDGAVEGPHVGDDQSESGAGKRHA